MADRYWVGGTGTWNSSNTTNWSATSGGAGGASVPTSVDSVFFNDSSASGAFTVTVSGSVNCSTFSCNPTTIKPCNWVSSGSDSINTYGSSIFMGVSSSETLVESFNGWLNVNTNSTLSGNAIFKNILFFNNVDVNLQFGVTTVVSEIKLSSGSRVRIRNDFKVNKVTGLVPSGLDVPRIDVGWASNQSAKLYIKGDNNAVTGAIGFWTLYPNNQVYLEPSGSTCTLNLGITSGSTTYAAQFQRITLKPLSSGVYFTIKGFGYFYDILKEPSTPATYLQFDPAGTYFFEDFSAEGDVTNTLNIQSSVEGSRATITKLDGGTVSTNYVTIRDMQPSPDDTWISYNSTNAGNNFRWYFDDFEKPTSNLFFGNAL